MKKKQSKILKEALKSFKTKNRLQELAGLNPTGCVNEHLDPTSQEGIALKKGINRVVNFMNGILHEIEDGESDTPLPSELCLKNVNLGGDSGTATACNDQCGGVLCWGCDCHTIDPGPSGNPIGKPIKVPREKDPNLTIGGDPSRPDVLPKRDMARMEEACNANRNKSITEVENVPKDGKCIGNVVQSGALNNQLSFRICGPCGTGADCPDGCGCVKKKGR